MEQTKLKETKQRNKTVGGTTSKGGLSTGGTKHEGCVCMECQGDGEGTYACGVGWGDWGFMVHVYVVHYRTWHCCHSYNHFFMNG